MVNAFWLDRDVERSARWLVDAHVTSSLLECSMVLTTAAQANGLADPDDTLYYTHADHPLTQWAAEALENWTSLHAYTDAAHQEWRYRWGHTDEESHGCWATVESMDFDAIEALDWPSETGSDPPQVTGEWTAEDYVDAYRYYYANEKRHLFAWAKDREAPPWLEEYTVPETEREASPVHS